MENDMNDKASGQVAQPPRPDAGDDPMESAVRACLADAYNLAGRLDRLPGENLNYLLTVNGNEKYVFKIVDEDMPRAVVELEFEVVRHARQAGFSVRLPKIIENQYGNIETRIKLPRDGHFRSRIIEFIDGTDLSTVSDISDILIENVGKTLAEFDRAMSTFDHPAAHRNHRWNLAESLQHEDKMRYVSEPEKRVLLQWAFDLFRDARPGLDRLPWQFIHGDAHDENLMVEGDAVVGLIDFGDCCYNPRVCEIAICMAYLMMRSEAPEAAARRLLEGYEWLCPLTVAEREAIYPLICGRIAVSLCIANARKHIDSLNPNWFGGEARTWKFLRTLREGIPLDFCP